MDEMCSELSFVCCQELDENLHNLVKHYMILENFGVAVVNQNNQKSIYDERSLTIAQTSIKLLNGKNEVKLPWKADIADLPESKTWQCRGCYVSKIICQFTRILLKLINSR